MSKSIENPCVRNCCLDGSDICLGCFRSLEEILAWAKADAEQQKMILAKADERRALSQRGG